MTTTNNFLKVLLHLKQFEGDGKFHEIEFLLSDLNNDEKREVFTELASEDLISLDGGTYTGLPIIVGYRNDTRKTFGGDNIEYIPFSAKLKFKGSKYLKEELEMIDKNKYHINVGENATANVIISSPGATINNKNELIDKAKTIIKTIENDTSIDNTTKQNAIGDINHFIEEIEKGRPTEMTVNKVLTLGANIGSIGSLVISLIQLLARH